MSRLEQPDTNNGTDQVRAANRLKTTLEILPGLQWTNLGLWAAMIAATCLLTFLAWAICCRRRTLLEFCTKGVWTSKPNKARFPAMTTTLATPNRVVSTTPSRSRSPAPTMSASPPLAAQATPTHRVVLQQPPEQARFNRSYHSYTAGLAEQAAMLQDHQVSLLRTGTYGQHPFTAATLTYLPTTSRQEREASRQTVETPALPAATSDAEEEANLTTPDIARPSVPREAELTPQH